MIGEILELLNRTKLKLNNLRAHGATLVSLKVEIK